MKIDPETEISKIIDVIVGSLEKYGNMLAFPLKTL